MPLRILPSLDLHACASLSCTSLQPSQVAQGSLLSSRPPHVMFLHKATVAILDPRDQGLPKLHMQYCSVWHPVILPWLLSKRNKPLRPPAGLSKIVPSSRRDTSTSSLSYNSLQPSHVAAGSLLSSRPTRPREIAPSAEVSACASGIYASLGALAVEARGGRVALSFLSLPLK